MKKILDIYVSNLFSIRKDVRKDDFNILIERIRWRLLKIHAADFMRVAICVSCLKRD